MASRKDNGKYGKQIKKLGLFQDEGNDKSRDHERKEREFCLSEGERGGNCR